MNLDENRWKLFLQASRTFLNRPGTKKNSGHPNFSGTKFSEKPKKFTSIKMLKLRTSNQYKSLQSTRGLENLIKLQQNLLQLQNSQLDLQFTIKCMFQIRLKWLSHSILIITMAKKSASHYLTKNRWR